MCAVLIMQSESYQEDIYPMTAGDEPAMTADEWLAGMDKGVPSVDQFNDLCPDVIPYVFFRPVYGNRVKCVLHRSNFSERVVNERASSARKAQMQSFTHYS